MDWSDAERQIGELADESRATYAEQLHSRRHFINAYEVAAEQNAASKAQVTRVQLILVFVAMLFSLVVAAILFRETPHAELPTTLWASLTALLAAVAGMTVTFLTAKRARPNKFETLALIEELNRTWIRLDQLEMENRVLKKTVSADPTQAPTAGEPHV